MTDLYNILGVPRGASQADLKKAYRKLAKELHPDLHPGNARVAERFKETSAAYAILGDEKTRGRYDRGEIDENGHERAFAGFSGAAGAQRARRGQAGARPASGPGFGDFKPEDFFSDIFGGRKKRGPQPQRGADRIYKVTIDFLDAVNGVKRRVALENGKTLAVKIPKMVREGQQIRLKGQGGEGHNGGHPGDALIEVDIRPHAEFRLEGHDIHLDLPVTLKEAVIGGEARVNTIDGEVSLKIPPGSNTGKTLRLRGKGVEKEDKTRGDQYVTLRVVLPDAIDDELKAFVERWSAAHPYSVRQPPK